MQSTPPHRRGLHQIRVLNHLTVATLHLYVNSPLMNFEGESQPITQGTMGTCVSGDLDDDDDDDSCEECCHLHLSNQNEQATREYQRVLI